MSQVCTLKIGFTADECWGIEKRVIVVAIAHAKRMPAIRNIVTEPNDSHNSFSFRTTPFIIEWEESSFRLPVGGEIRKILKVICRTFQGASYIVDIG